MEKTGDTSLKLLIFKIARYKSHPIDLGLILKDQHKKRSCLTMVWWDPLKAGPGGSGIVKSTFLPDIVPTVTKLHFVPTIAIVCD